MEHWEREIFEGDYTKPAPSRPVQRPHTSVDIPQEEVELDIFGEEPLESLIEGGTSIATLPAGIAPYIPAIALPAAAAGAYGVGKLIAGKTGALHAPGHNYLGPGSDVDSGLPTVDKDDEIALSHDKRYQSAIDWQDVKDADQEAIDRFDADYSQTGNLHSKVGSTLLGVKQAVEHYVGPIYPQV
jgi:hypothetical protein